MGMLLYDDYAVTRLSSWSHNSGDAANPGGAITPQLADAASVSSASVETWQMVFTQPVEIGAISLLGHTMDPAGFLGTQLYAVDLDGTPVTLRPWSVPTTVDGHTHMIGIIDPPVTGTTLTVEIGMTGGSVLGHIMPARRLEIPIDQGYATAFAPTAQPQRTRGQQAYGRPAPVARTLTLPTTVRDLHEAYSVDQIGDPITLTVDSVSAGATDNGDGTYSDANVEVTYSGLSVGVDYVIEAIALHNESEIVSAEAQLRWGSGTLIKSLPFSRKLHVLTADEDTIKITGDQGLGSNDVTVGILRAWPLQASAGPSLTDAILRAGFTTPVLAAAFSDDLRMAEHFSVYGTLDQQMTLTNRAADFFGGPIVIREAL